jgi:peroxiredoxin
MIQAGDTAPDFTLKANDNNLYTLSEQKGQRVLLVFYPMDFSPVCSNEMSCFVDDIASFGNAGIKVFGVSIDSAWSHKAFAASKNIQFPLLADFHPKGAASARFGLYYEDKGFTHRAVVLIGADGVVEKVWHYEIGQAPDIKAIISEIV